MENKISYNLFWSLLIITLIGMTSACSSSRRPVHDPIYDAGKSTTDNKKQHNPKPSIKNKNLDVPAQKLLLEAESWLGTKYAYGGHSKKGTDCSGFVMEVYRNATGIKLPRTTIDQRNFCDEINFNKLDAGDLVFFTSKKGKGKVNHVGIYIGDGKMIHASSSRGVIISRLNEKYYVTYYHSSGRVGNFRQNRNSKMKSSEKARNHEAARKTTVDRLDEVLTQKLDSIYSGMMD